MTAADVALLKAEIALLKSMSPTKGKAARYGEADLRRAFDRMGDQLAFAPYLRLAPPRP